MDIEILKRLGFSDKCAKVYLSLLALGPSSVRALSKQCGLNRGSTYDCLKWLKEAKVVDYYHKDSKQTFVVENPIKLRDLVKNRELELKDAEVQLEKVVPELQAIHNKGGNRPVARYFDKEDIVKILQDVLEVCEQDEEKIYRIYSTSGIRQHLYEGFVTFSDVRVAKGISVKAIAIGEGGELRGLDERKWLQSKNGTPTYIFIYPGKTAYLSLDAKKELVGVVIENDGVYETQKEIFDALWNRL